MLTRVALFTLLVATTAARGRFRENRDHIAYKYEVCDLRCDGITTSPTTDDSNTPSSGGTFLSSEPTTDGSHSDTTTPTVASSDGFHTDISYQTDVTLLETGSLTTSSDVASPTPGETASPTTGSDVTSPTPGETKSPIESVTEGFPTGTDFTVPSSEPTTDDSHSHITEETVPSSQSTIEYSSNPTEEPILPSDSTENPIGSNPTVGTTGSNPTEGSTGSNPTEGSIGSNPTEETTDPNTTEGPTSPNPTGTATIGITSPPDETSPSPVEGLTGFNPTDGFTGSSPTEGPTGSPDQCGAVSSSVDVQTNSRVSFLFAIALQIQGNASTNLTVSIIEALTLCGTPSNNLVANLRIVLGINSGNLLVASNGLLFEISALIGTQKVGISNNLVRVLKGYVKTQNVLQVLLSASLNFDAKVSSRGYAAVFVAAALSYRRTLTGESGNAIQQVYITNRLFVQLLIFFFEASSRQTGCLSIYYGVYDGSISFWLTPVEEGKSRGFRRVAESAKSKLQGTKEHLKTKAHVVEEHQKAKSHEKAKKHNEKSKSHEAKKHEAKKHEAKKHEQKAKNDEKSKSHETKKHEAKHHEQKTKHHEKSKSHEAKNQNHAKAQHEAKKHEQKTNKHHQNMQHEKNNKHHEKSHANKKHEKGLRVGK